MRPKFATPLHENRCNFVIATRVVIATHVVIADLIRNPWIPDRVRDDSLETPDLIRGLDDL